MTTKIIIKKGLSSFISGCGLFSAFERYRMADKAFILMYHRVLGQNYLHDTFVQPGMYVTRNTFDRHISFLKSKYQILFLDELIDKVNRNENMSGCCAITFDDGWRDNYTEAFSVLKKYQVPATIFLATAYVGTNRLFWPEELCCHLEQQHHIRDSSASYPLPVLRFNREIKKYHSDKRVLFLNNVIQILKGYLPDERKQVLEYYRGMSQSPCVTRQMMDWEEADEMKISGLIAFGAHTVQHEILDQIPISDVRTEIYQSKAEIEKKLGVKVNTFSYPNGNYNKDIVNVLNKGNFTGAVTTRKGYLGQHTPLMEIPRIGMHEDISCTIPMLQSRIILEKF